MNAATAATLDVSHLEVEALDHRSPLWWGNLWLLTIETTMFAILVASYFYLRLNFEQWPPPRVDRTPILYDAKPDVGPGTINLVLLLVMCVPMFIADRACFKLNRRIVNICTVIAIALGIAATVVRFYEFRAVHFRWDDNAYGSIVWAILAMHLAHLITATIETAVMTTWTFRYPLDKKRARDVRLTSIYWYWEAATWVVLYVVVYWVPRFGK